MDLELAEEAITRIERLFAGVSAGHEAPRDKETLEKAVLDIQKGLGGRYGSRERTQSLWEKTQILFDGKAVKKHYGHESVREQMLADCQELRRIATHLQAKDRSGAPPSAPSGDEGAGQ